MVQNCCVPGCKNVWRPNSCIAYHTFPLKNKARFVQWMQVDELKDINVNPGKRICSAHFTPDSFEEFCSVKRLKRNAVPSLFGEAVRIIDDSSTEIIEIWEEICTDSISEDTVTVLNEVTKIEQKTRQEVETRQKIDQEMRQEIDQEIKQKTPLSSTEEYDFSITEVEQNVEQETGQEIDQETERETLLSSVEHDLPIANTVETKDASVQTLSVYYEFREEMWNLRKKIAMLRWQIKQRDLNISNTQKLINRLINIRDSKRNTDPPAGE
ncbi:PREDICTED: THAP domain-containing protein 1-like isoform X2 [Dinoponera quadriceps]|uniref:THAP domain-containing protein 1-like isoform X2 n=1 Tax=Dinoponera quadriceps TaxID=609295 RepID=A0A6P3X3G9_DINQU|nr:PREDICTED: THAP domain-containing protein 1-like isoform X2 [Dinoponera quadriceps]